MEQQTSDDDSFEFPTPGNHYHLHNNSSSQFHNHQEQPQMSAQEEEESSQMLPSNPFFRPGYHHHNLSQFHGGGTTSRTSNMNGFHGQTQSPVPWNPMPVSSYHLDQYNSGDLRLIAAQLEHKPQQQPTTMGDDHHRLLQTKTETPLIMIRTPGLTNDIDELSVAAQNGKLTENGGGLVENGGGLTENGGGGLTENGCGLTENGGGLLTENGLMNHPKQPPPPLPQHAERRKRRLEDETAALLRWRDQKRQQKVPMETSYNKLLNAVNKIDRRWMWLESQFRESAKIEAARRNLLISWITKRDAIIVSHLESLNGQKIHLPPLDMNFMNNNNGSTTASAAATSTDAHLYHHHQQYIPPSFQVQHPPQPYTHFPYQGSVIAPPFVNVMSPSQSPARSSAEPGFPNSGTIMINTNNTNNSIIDQNSTRWAEEETHTLIEIRSSMGHNFNEPTGSKRALWEEISEKMKSIGYMGRTWNRCKEKWENCQKYYRKSKEEDKAATVATTATSGDNGGGTSSTESARKRARHSRTKSYFMLLADYNAKYEGLEIVGGGGSLSENEINGSSYTMSMSS